MSYLEGCTAPQFDTNQLHAAVVELVALDNADIKYSTVQNWYAGDENGKGGIYNFVTKRGLCKGINSKISWTQVETGSAITWKYPSCVLLGDNSTGEFYSVALTNHLPAGRHRYQNDPYRQEHPEQDHLEGHFRRGVRTTAIAAWSRSAAARAAPRNYSQCDSMLIGDRCGANTFPTIDVQNTTATIEHEASTSKIGEDQMFLLRAARHRFGRSDLDDHQRFCKDVFVHLPMEFAVEATKLLGLKLEGSVG